MCVNGGVSMRSLQYTHDLEKSLHAQQKKRVSLNILRLSQLQLDDTMSLPHCSPMPMRLHDSMCTMCRASPECNQSNVSYGRNLTCDR